MCNFRKCWIERAGPFAQKVDGLLLREGAEPYLARSQGQSNSPVAGGEERAATAFTGQEWFDMLPVQDVVQNDQCAFASQHLPQPRRAGLGRLVVFRPVAKHHADGS